MRREGETGGEVGETETAGGPQRGRQVGMGDGEGDRWGRWRQMGQTERETDGEMERETDGGDGEGDRWRR